MQAVSFMYVRPPGYNAESAKAAELADERKKEELSSPNADGPSSSMYLLFIHSAYIFSVARSLVV